MATASIPNQRASLLSGLRTGGVRAPSNPLAAPHTAAPGGSFNVPRFSSASLSHQHFPEEEEDQYTEMPPQHSYANQAAMRHQAPMTAAVDGSNNRFMQQQNMGGGMQYNTPTYGGHMQAQAQAMQMQMMQMEIMRLQAIQAQQFQAEMIAQAQRQQPAQPARRAMGYNPPATAGPMNTSFDARAMGGDMQMRRPSQGTQFIANMDAVPMTAALGGKFGGRVQGNGSGRYSDDESDPKQPLTASRVISGGISLGGSVPSSTGTTVLNQAASKADGASSWRRGSVNTALNAARVGSPSVRITPPPSERTSPPPAPTPTKSRPQPLLFGASSPSLPLVAIVDTDAADGDDSETVSSGSDKSGPTTPTSAGSQPPLSPREEAAKKLYEGLGLGRPVPGVVAPPPTAAAVQRIMSQAVRMPRGPPSGADELGPKNFATRIRRKAIGGLGALMGARERREVEAF